MPLIVDLLQDNIFTVSFYTGREDGPLLSDVGGFSGY